MLLEIWPTLLYTGWLIEGQILGSLGNSSDRQNCGRYLGEQAGSNLQAEAIAPRLCVSQGGSAGRGVRYNLTVPSGSEHWVILSSHTLSSKYSILAFPIDIMVLCHSLFIQTHPLALRGAVYIQCCNSLIH